MYNFIAYFKHVFASAYISAKKVVINTVYLNSNWSYVDIPQKQLCAQKTI